MISLIFNAILFHLIGVSSASFFTMDTFKKESEFYFTCRGRTTAASKFTQDKLDITLSCLGSITEGKYCQVKCLARKGRFLKDDGKPNYDRIESEFKEYQLFNDKTDDVLDAVRKCSKGRTYSSDVNNCQDARAFYYCMHNRYNEICQKNARRMDIEDLSEENGILDRAFGGDIFALRG